MVDYSQFKETRPALEKKKEGATGEFAFNIFILSHEKH